MRMMWTGGFVLLLEVSYAVAKTDLCCCWPRIGLMIAFGVLNPHAMIARPDKIEDADGPFEAHVGQRRWRGLC